MLATPVVARRRILEEGKGIQIQHELMPKRQACTRFAREQRFDVFVTDLHSHGSGLDMQQCVYDFWQPQQAKVARAFQAQSERSHVHSPCPEIKRDSLARF